MVNDAEESTLYKTYKLRSDFTDRSSCDTANNIEIQKLNNEITGIVNEVIREILSKDLALSEDYVITHLNEVMKSKANI